MNLLSFQIHISFVFASHQSLFIRWFHLVKSKENYMFRRVKDVTLVACHLCLIGPFFTLFLSWFHIKSAWKVVTILGGFFSNIFSTYTGQIIVLWTSNFPPCALDRKTKWCHLLWMSYLMNTLYTGTQRYVKNIHLLYQLLKHRCLVLSPQNAQMLVHAHCWRWGHERCELGNRSF